MKEAVLMSDFFPRSVVFRLTQQGGRVRIRFQWQRKPYQVEAATVEDAVRTALEAVKALEAEGLS